MPYLHCFRRHAAALRQFLQEISWDLAEYSRAGFPQTGKARARRKTCWQLLLKRGSRRSRRRFPRCPQVGRFGEKRHKWMAYRQTKQKSPGPAGPRALAPGDFRFTWLSLAGAPGWSVQTHPAGKKKKQKKQQPADVSNEDADPNTGLVCVFTSPLLNTTTNQKQKTPRALGERKGMAPSSRGLPSVLGSRLEDTLVGRWKLYDGLDYLEIWLGDPKALESVCARWRKYHVRHRDRESWG